MSDEKDDGQQGFKVSDRRRRYAETPEEGAPAAPKEETPQPAAAAPAPEPEPEPASLGEPIPEEGPLAGEPGPGAGGAIGPAELVQLVGKLYEEALVFMGYHDDPRAGASMRNLPVAGWHIDILGVLKEKTKGNLTAEEAKLVDDAIANLKVLFVRASGYIKH